jgi:oligopeptidase B
MINKKIIFIAVIFSASARLFGGEAEKLDIVPPVARIIEKVDTVHGDVRVDNYYWLRDRQNPEVIEYLKAENEYTRLKMLHTEDMQSELYKEMLSRIKETDLSVPVRIGNYYYYSRTEKGKQYAIYCRREGDLGGREQVLLDLNSLADRHAYLELGAYEVSPDHNYLAYSLDTTGSERYTLYIKDITEDTLVTEQVENVGYQLAWANDNRTIFYSVLDEAKRPYQVYRHIIDTDPAADSLVYHEKDEAFWIDIYKTRSRKYILIQTDSHNTTEVRYLSADEPLGEFKVIEPREAGVEYYLDHRGGTFYIRTNRDVENFKLMVTPVRAPAAKNWQDFVPHRDSVTIDDFDVFLDHIVLYEKERGLGKIRIINLPEKSEHYVEFSEPTYAIFRDKNPEFCTHTLRFTYMSLVTPKSVFDYDMNTRIRELKKQYEVLGGYEPGNYRSERIWAQGRDGTMIPISLVYKKGLMKNGTNPLLLDGYGAYGLDEWPYFSSNRISLLDRGFVYAIAHVRGGGEMGKYWHQQGSFLNKINTFTDFIACAEHLIEQKYTSSQRLVIYGGSAGGTLIGAVVNMRPELFRAAIADVPFVDIINTLLDPSIPLTVVEYTELGNPFEKEFYEYMKRYAPYDNVTAQDYPSMLVRAGFNDPRVGYWEPAKWVAKLRALKTDDHLLLLEVNMDAGHGGPSGRYDYLTEVAFQYAFLLDVLGIAGSDVTDQ